MRGTVVYLHGFASSPASSKGAFFRNLATTVGYECAIPDLNHPSFRSLTLSRTIETAAEVAARSSGPLIFVGSSFGALTVLHLLARSEELAGRTSRVVLVAPALELPERWEGRLSPEELERWRLEGERMFPHYATGKPEPLAFEFVTDLGGYAGKLPSPPGPTLIVHGNRDEVAPIGASVRYAAREPVVRLETFDTDHQMLDVLEPVGRVVREFLG